MRLLGNLNFKNKRFFDLFLLCTNQPELDLSQASSWNFIYIIVLSQYDMMQHN